MIVNFNMMKTHYNCVSLFFSKMKRIISASNVDAETIRDAINECNDVLWLSWVASEDALIAAMTLKLELEIIDDRLLEYVIKKNSDISNQRDWPEFYREKEAQIDHDLACFECSKIQFWSSWFSEFLSRKWNKKEWLQYDRRKDKNWDRDDAQSMQ